MITNENYEGYLMRYADGELDQVETAAVESFLAEHPELREELEELTSPALRVTAPMATMPGKERMLHTETPMTPLTMGRKWMAIAATITAFVIATIAIHIMFQHDKSNVIMANADTIGSTVSDTIPPDSIYINPAKRLPVYLADDNSNQKIRPIKQNDMYNQPHEDITDDEEYIPSLEQEIIPGDMIAENQNKPSATNVRMIGGRVIVVETNQLVEIVPERNAHYRPDATRGYIIENSYLAEEEQKGILDRTIYFIANRLKRSSYKDDTTFAYINE